MSNHFPQGYDPITLNHYLWYKLKCHEGSPSDFQYLFEQIIKRAKPEFISIRPYGNIGDRKCDGLFVADQHIFQVYAPDELTQQKLIEKIDDDLSCAAAHWQGQMAWWTFVYNVRRGLPPDVPSILNSQRKRYPKIQLDHLSNDGLWEYARSLTLQQRVEILGAPSGYEHLFFSPTTSPEDIRQALDNGWFVIVHDTMTPINLRSVTDALAPAVPFGAPLYIRPNVGPLPWDEAAAFQKTAVLDAVEKSRDVLPRFAVFSLSQIALCIHLGFVLTDRLEVRYFQFDRDQRIWRWPVLDGPVDTTINVEGIPAEHIDGPYDAIIRISLSDTISKAATLLVTGHTPVQIDISVESPDVMWLKSPEQLFSLGRTFRQVLASIRSKVPNCTRIHLFYAGPTSGAIIVGQQINPRMNPPIELYEYSRHSSPQHRHALTLKY